MLTRLMPISRRTAAAVSHGLLPVLGLVAGCVSGPAAAFPPPADTEADDAALLHTDALDEHVPAPGPVIGHPVGADAVRYDRLRSWCEALAAASPFVTLTPYAESHEGRTLFFLTITSDANHARLDEILADNAKLADPRRLDGDAAADRIIERLPGVAWLAYSIHGDELSSSDAAMLVAWHLAAGTDDETRGLRDELVVCIDPLQNPDGRERYLAQLQTLRGRVANPDFQAMQHSGLWSAGRGNHYLFDLNRDWVPLVQPETRGRAAAIRRFNPHLLVDSHEMGGLDTYLFDPPREPVNVSLSERNEHWRGVFSADQARAFDAFGWSYYTREWYEEWYPGYTNAWANLLGAVGILYEQAGVNGASLRQATGLELTYREAVHHQYVSSLANLRSLRAHRTGLLRDYLADRRWAVSGDAPLNETFLLAPTDDAARFDAFRDVLDRQGIEWIIADAPFTARGVRGVRGDAAEAREFPSGTLVVDPRQPHRRLLHAVLGFDPHMSEEFLLEERRELENRRGSRLYDVTAWNLPMAYGLEASWAASVDDVPARDAPARTPADVDADAGYGYLVHGADARIHAAVAALLARGCRPRLASKPLRIGDRAYPRGSVLLRAHEHDDDLPAVLAELAERFPGLRIDATGTALSTNGWDLGGRRLHLLAEPRVAIASQWPVSTTSFGAVWHALDARLGLRVSPVNIQHLGRTDLRKYNVIVLPTAWGQAGLAGVLDEPTRAHLRTWVRAGGTLVAFGGSAAFLAHADRGLSSVRLRRDVLGELEAYDEAVGRELAAFDVSVDPDAVWGTDAGEPGPEEETTGEGDAAPPAEGATTRPDATGRGATKRDLEALRREDAWRRVFSPAGVFADTRLDGEHWLTVGLGERLPVLFSGASVLMSRHPVRTPVRLADAEEVRLSGLLWPEARTRLARSAYATVERSGNGQVILFAGDPFFRGYAEGTSRLALNAIVFGPGMGTSPPIPW
ncbi:MAG: M14 family zinc carboxypeptidase [Planctomycetota bacterium]|jgi:hypothetical protein